MCLGTSLSFKALKASRACLSSSATHVARQEYLLFPVHITKVLKGTDWINSRIGTHRHLCIWNKKDCAVSYAVYTFALENVNTQSGIIRLCDAMFPIPRLAGNSYSNGCMARLNSLCGKSGKHRTSDTKHTCNNTWRKSPRTLAGSLIPRTPESTFCHLDLFSKRLSEDVEQVYAFCWNLLVPQGCSHHFTLAIHACICTFINAHAHSQSLSDGERREHLIWIFLSWHLAQNLNVEKISIFVK